MRKGRHLSDAEVRKFVRLDVNTGTITLVLVLLLTSLAMCSTLLGGYVAIKAHRRIHLLMGLGAGVLLGAVFFDLLPEALSVAQEQGWGFRVVLGIVLGGVLLFYLV